MRPRPDLREHPGRPPERLDPSRIVPVPGTEGREVVVGEEEDPVRGEVEAEVARGVSRRDDRHRLRMGRNNFV